MKKLLTATKTLAFAFAATGLSGASGALAAPKPVARKPLPMKNIAPQTVPVQAAGPLQKVIPPGKPGLGAGYTPSRFPGVSVRRAPVAASQSRGVELPNRGVALGSARRAADPRNGVKADVDPRSFPTVSAASARNGAASRTNSNRAKAGNQR